MAVHTAMHATSVLEAPRALNHAQSIAVVMPGAEPFLMIVRNVLVVTRGFHRVLQTATEATTSRTSSMIVVIIPSSMIVLALPNASAPTSTQLIIVTQIAPEHSTVPVSVTAVTSSIAVGSVTLTPAMTVSKTATAYSADQRSSTIVVPATKIQTTTVRLSPTCLATMSSMASLQGTKLFDTRTYQIDLNTIGAGEEVPDCEPNDDNVCVFTNLGLSDITDPYNPTEISLNELEYPSFDIVINDAQNFLFLAAGSMGYQVVQVLTDPPYLSVLYDREIPDDQPADATEANQVFFKRAGLSDEIKVVAIETQGDYAYVLYSGSFNPQSQTSNPVFAALEVISFSNFPTIETVGYVELTNGRQAFDLSINGNYAYLAGGTDGVHVLDIAQPSSPGYLSSISLKDSFGSFALGETVAVQDEVLVVTTPNGGEVFDVSIPSLPTSTGDFLSTYPREVFIDDRQTSNGPITTLFIADQSAGMSIYELNNDLEASFRGILALNIPAENCLNPDPNNPGQCVSSAKAIKIVGNLAYVVTDMGLFVASLGF